MCLDTKSTTTSTLKYKDVATQVDFITSTFRPSQGRAGAQILSLIGLALNSESVECDSEASTQFAYGGRFCSAWSKADINHKLAVVVLWLIIVHDKPQVPTMSRAKLTFFSIRPLLSQIIVRISTTLCNASN
jgi:hypothetical protein